MFRAGFRAGLTHEGRFGEGDGRQRTVTLIADQHGMIVHRDEVDTSPRPGSAHARYFVAGRQVGELTNDGYSDPNLANYAQALELRNKTDNKQVTAFRWNTWGPVTGGKFGLNGGYDALNPYGAGAAGPGASYTVQSGDTLQSIAANAWGDAQLWYLIAEANGLSAGSPLAEGQSIAIPDRVAGGHHNADTFRAYDSARAMGDLSPTTPKPAKSNKCGVVGQIMLVAIAVAVSIVIHLRPLVHFVYET